MRGKYDFSRGDENDNVKVVFQTIKENFEIRGKWQEFRVRGEYLDIIYYLEKM